MAEKLTDTKLKALLAQGISNARQYDSAERAEGRQRELEYFQGKMTDVPAPEHRSSVVSTDIADVIGWVLPGIMRVFTASDRVVDYEPVGEGDEDAADQASDYCNYVFWKDNAGYRVMYNATFDSLLHGNGIVKHWWDDTEEAEQHSFTGLNELALAELTQDDRVEVLAANDGEEPGTFDVKINHIKSRGRVAIEAIAQEDFLIDDAAITIEDSRFCAHRDRVTRSELVERGFAREKVKAIPSYEHSDDTLDDLAREDDDVIDDDFNEPSMEYIDIYECYIRVDADGDDVTETVRAYYAGEVGGGQLLDWEVWDDEVPFSDIPCFPMPHRWAARSISDEVMEMQRVKTAVTRQAMDNLYASNLPMREIEEGSVLNMDMMYNPKFGGVIVRKKNSAPTQPTEVPFVAGEAFNVLRYADEVIERRTGVSKASAGLDPDALQNQTATAVQNQRDASFSQIELIARNQAELGWRRVFRQILKLVTKHQDQRRVIRLRDKWVEMDPRAWNSSMDATINVGLGTGSRDRDMMMLNQILGHQTALGERAAQMGFPDMALDMLPRAIQTMRKIAESAGIKNPDAYYPEISDEMLAAGKQRIEQMQQKGDPKLQAEMQKLQQEALLKQDELQIRREEIAMEMQLKREQLEAEMALKREQLEAELLLKREMGFVSGYAKAGGLSDVRMGGEPG